MRCISIVYGILLLPATMFSTASAQATKSDDYPAFFRIAHRGARGAMPENTIPAMKKAIDQGANTLELDIHITKDNKVVVYHDASLNPDYTTHPGGEEIPKDKRKDYTLYKMNYDEIRKFDSVLNEEHRDVVADEIPVAFLGVKLHGKSADIARRVDRAGPARDGRKANEDLRLFADFRQDLGARELLQ